MIILGTPVRIIHIPQIILGMISRCINRKKKRVNVDSKFNLVYFSYEPDYEFLRLSIESVIKYLPSGIIRSINIFIDDKAPFTDEQKNCLDNLYSNITFDYVSNFSWGSAESTLAEIACFKKIVKHHDFDNDFLVKIDSDIVFIGQSDIVELLQSSYDAIGDGHYSGYGYAQGGMYFIRHHLISSILSRVTLDEIEQVEKDIKSTGEDRAISEILERKGHGFKLMRYMLFPNEYSRLDKITKLCRFEFFSCHCVKEKEKMKNLFDKY